MKYCLIVLASVFIVLQSSGQTNFNDSISSARIRITREAMIGLGAWSVLNISSGFIIANQTSGEAKYFWRMNAYWNFFNLGLAALGYAGTRSMSLHHYSFAENMKEQRGMEKLYIFNLGLDLVYIGGGFYLRERAKNEKDPDKADQFAGYGSSIIVQGGFLFLMDTFIYLLHHKNTIRMDNKLERLELNAGPCWVGLTYSF